MCTCCPCKLSCLTGTARCMHAVCLGPSSSPDQQGRSRQQEASLCRRLQALSQLSGSRCPLSAAAKQSQPWGDGSAYVCHPFLTAWNRTPTPQCISAFTGMPWGVRVLFRFGRKKWPAVCRRTPASVDLQLLQQTCGCPHSVPEKVHIIRTDQCAGTYISGGKHNLTA